LTDEAKRAVDDLEGLSSGRLIIGASSTVGEQFLPAYLGRFHTTYPNISLEIAISNTDAILQRVLERELDLAFIGRAPNHPDLVAEPVFADRIVAFVAPGDPLLRDAPIDPAHLSNAQFVVRERGSATRDLALRCLRSAGCIPGHIIELGSNEAVKRAVEARLGIGLLSTHAIEAERLAGLLEDLPLLRWDCRRSFWLIYLSDRTLTRAERAFLALLQQS
jgi:DNA-binding transcriptional LysR family regulator